MVNVFISPELILVHNPNDLLKWTVPSQNNGEYPSPVACFHFSSFPPFRPLSVCLMRSAGGRKTLRTIYGAVIHDMSTTDDFSSRMRLEFEDEIIEMRRNAIVGRTRDQSVLGCCRRLFEMETTDGK